MGGNNLRGAGSHVTEIIRLIDDGQKSLTFDPIAASPQIATLKRKQTFHFHCGYSGQRSPTRVGERWPWPTQSSQVTLCSHLQSCAVRMHCPLTPRQLSLPPQLSTIIPRTPLTPEFLPTSHALFMDTSEQFLPTFLWNGCLWRTEGKDGMWLALRAL